MKAIESDISRLTVLSSTLFSQLEDALEREQLSRPVTAATGMETPVMKGGVLSRAQMEKMWDAPMCVRSPVLEDKDKKRDERVPAAVVKEDEDSSDEETAHENEPGTQTGTMQDISPTKQTQYVTQQDALPAPRTAPTLVVPISVYDEEDVGNISSDAVAVEEVRFDAGDMDNLRCKAQASIARLQRRRQTLRQVQNGYAAYLERLARTERQLTTVAGKWEADERARLEREARRVRGKRGREDDHEEEEGEETETANGRKQHGWRLGRKMRRCAEVCAWVGVGAAAAGAAGRVFATGT